MFNVLFISAIICMLTLNANADVTEAKMHFMVRDGNKVFGVQHFPKKNLYIINFELLWSNFNQEVHSNGYNLVRTTGLEFVSPVRPEKCYLSDPITVTHPISGYINGVEEGSSSIQIALKGEDCAKYVEDLKDSNFVADFKNVQALQQGAPIT